MRYLGFTPGQYGAAAPIVVGALILCRVPAHRESPAADSFLKGCSC
jgi:hypothetical protein